MKTQIMNNTGRCAVFVLLAALAASSAVSARDRGKTDSYEHRPAAHQHFDNRFAHNHYYFDRGYTMRAAPRIGVAIDHGRNHFWYARGEWYRRDGVRWVVVGAPLGAFVPVLPLSYTTVWFSGAPYYYANDTYYTWDANHHEYEVVPAPAGIDASGSTQAPPSDSIFVYPKNGQSPEQQARDEYECHHSAVEHTGYDPTVAGGGVAPAIATEKRSDYFRAQAACLDARGYSVK
jgi:hypothetical protein